MSVSQQRPHVAAMIRSMDEGTQIRVKMRPRGTSRAPSLDPFSEALFVETTSLQELADSEGVTIEGVLDLLLLSLWDALFLSRRACNGPRTVWRISHPTRRLN